jgi:sugar phosphate isomerase/epimerase
MARKPAVDNIDEVIKALQFSGADEIELASVNVEPGPTGQMIAAAPPSAYPPSFREPTAAEIAFYKQRVRKELRDWRTSAANHNIGRVRDKFKGAGISVFAYSVDYEDNFPEDEMEVTFQQAKSLGVEVITASASLATAERLAVFAAKHQMLVSFRNTGAENMTKLLAISKQFRLNFDIGNFVAANGDPVSFLQQNSQHVTHLRIKDRRRNGGANEKFGEGDTPIKSVLALVKEKKLAIPAFVDYEYIGIGTPQEEVKRCMNYLRSAA